MTLTRFENKKDFHIYFSEVRHGWVSILFFSKGKLIMDISASGVYNPFYDLVDFLKNISLNKNGIYVWEVDQEGYDGVITATVKGKKIIIEMETFTSREKLPYFKLEISKKEFIKEVYCKLNKYYFDNKKIIFDEVYELNFNINELRKIKW